MAKTVSKKFEYETDYSGFIGIKNPDQTATGFILNSSMGSYDGYAVYSIPELTEKNIKENFKTEQDIQNLMDICGGRAGAILDKNSYDAIKTADYSYIKNANFKKLDNGLYVDVPDKKEPLVTIPDGKMADGKDMKNVMVFNPENESWYRGNNFTMSDITNETYEQMLARHDREQKQFSERSEYNTADYREMVTRQDKEKMEFYANAIKRQPLGREDSFADMKARQNKEINDLNKIVVKEIKKPAITENSNVSLSEMLAYTDRVGKQKNMEQLAFKALSEKHDSEIEEAIQRSPEFKEQYEQYEFNADVKEIRKEFAQCYDGRLGEAINDMGYSCKDVMDDKDLSGKFKSALLGYSQELYKQYSTFEQNVEKGKIKETADCPLDIAIDIPTGYESFGEMKERFDREYDRIYDLTGKDISLTDRHEKEFKKASESKQYGDEFNVSVWESFITDAKCMETRFDRDVLKDYLTETYGQEKVVEFLDSQQNEYLAQAVENLGENMEPARQSKDGNERSER